MNINLLSGVLAALMLVGCSASYPLPDETRLAPSCCQLVSQIPYYPIITPNFEQTFEVSPKSPVFDFSTGLSPFQAVKLPEHSGKLRVALRSLLEKQVFVPYVLLLDQDFNQLDAISAEAAEIKYGTVIKRNYLQYEFELTSKPYDKSAPKYLLFYTQPQEIGQATAYKSAELRRAEEQGLALPIAAQPSAKHSYFGRFELELEPLTFEAVTQPQQNQGLQSKTVPEEEIAADAVKPVASELTIQPETELFYVELIRSSVKNGDIDKALKLVEEAERAGSQKARQTFIEAVKQQK